MEMTREIWKAMGGKDQTLWLERNKPTNQKSITGRSTLYGRGVNDASYCAQPVIGGRCVRCPAYNAWSSIMERCYSEKFHIKQPTYIGVTTCSDWQKFTNFREWWIAHQIDGFQIDKDLIGDGTEYAPSSCIFVPQWLNSFTTDSGATRGEWPIGASFHDKMGKFRARCRNVITGKEEHLGLFETPEEAHIAWRTRRLEIALDLKSKMDELDLRIYPGAIKIINGLR